MRQVVIEADQVRLVEWTSWQDRVLILFLLLAGLGTATYYGWPQQLRQWVDTPPDPVVVALPALAVLIVILIALHRLFIGTRVEWLFSADAILRTRKTLFGFRRKSWRGDIVTAIILQSARDGESYRIHWVDVRLRSGQTLKLPCMNVDDRNELAHALAGMYPDARWILGRGEPRSEEDNW